MYSWTIWESNKSVNLWWQKKYNQRNWLIHCGVLHSVEKKTRQIQFHDFFKHMINDNKPLGELVLKIFSSKVDKGVCTIEALDTIGNTSELSVKDYSIQLVSSSRAKKIEILVK